MKSFDCLIVSSFTCDPLMRYLTGEQDGVKINARTTDYGQVFQTLLSPATTECNTAVVWTRLEDVVPAFAKAQQGEPPTREQWLNELEQYLDALTAFCQKYDSVFHPLWHPVWFDHGLGLLDYKYAQAPELWRSQANHLLLERAANIKSLFITDTNRWLAEVGPRAINPKTWYLGKMYYDHRLLQVAARDIRAALAAQAGLGRKLVVLDLDNTLWGGIVGDDGWENLALGGHDPAGEAYVDFQRALKAVKSRGILLALASKNDEQVALEAIDKHPEMVLKKSDFVAWRINWQDKAGNIADMVRELNLGLQSVVFIDDNPMERARVCETLPEVLCPDWPEDPMLYPQALASLACFDTSGITAEDRERTTSYQSEKARNELRAGISSTDEWLAALELEVKIDPPLPENLDRIVQLLNKTNQMNLSTRRLTLPEMQSWLQDPANKLWAIRVADRFGDYGLTGIVSVSLKDEVAEVVDFILSCRVFGRQVEDRMLAEAIDYARKHGASSIKAKYLPTPKNKPCLDFFAGLQQWQQKDNVFTLVL